MFKNERYKDLNPRYTLYAEDVLSGKIKTGNYIRLACKRYLSWFSREDIFFNEKLMDKIFNFFSHLRHFEAEFSGKPFILLPFQLFIICQIMGWFYSSDPEKRVCEEALILIARKNGKSSLIAALALAEIVCGTSEKPNSALDHAEGYIISNTRDQSKIDLKFIQGYAKSLDAQCKKQYFKHYQNYTKYLKKTSIIKALSAEAGVSDGLRPQIVICDELHATQDESMIQVCKSGMASAKNPMFLICSSAGYLLSGYPLYERVQIGQQRLDGAIDFPDDVSYFIFTMDADDDWTCEENWIKPNPGLDEIVSRDFLRKRIKDSKVNLSTQIDTKIKNLAMWVTSKNGWLKNDALDKVCTHLDLSQLEGCPCWAGCDLSSINDLTSIALCWPPDPSRSYYPDRYLFHAFAWIPQSGLDGPNGAKYEQWLHAGYAQLTSGNVVDYDEILKCLIEITKKFPINKFFYDEWNSSSFILNLLSINIIPSVEPMSQSIGSFSRPTKAFEVMVYNEQLLIDSNPLVRYCFDCVSLKYDSFGNVKPMKDTGNSGAQANTKKIDIVIAMLEALAAHLYEELFQGEMNIITLDL